MNLKQSLPPLLIFSTLSVPVMAADDASLDPILVTSSRIGLTKNLPANVTIITEADIHNSPEQTLPALLSKYAGVNVTSFYNHGTSASVDIRGFGETAGQNTLILLDGRRLNEIDQSNINFASIPFENIARIEIIRGSGAVLYGEGASGGVINIITKSPANSDSYTKLTGTVGSESHRTGNAYAVLNNEHFGLSANINSTHDDGYRDNNEYRQNSGQLDFRLPISNDELYVKVGSYNSHIQYPGSRNFRPREIVSFFGTQPVDLSLVNDRKGTDTPDDKARERVHYSNIGYTSNLSEKITLVIDGGYRKKDSTAEFVSSSNTVKTDHTAYSFTPRLIHEQALSFGSMTTILGMDWYTHNYDSVSSFGSREIDQKNHAFYWQSSMTVANNTILTGGLRTDEVNFNGQNLTTDDELKNQYRENSYELGIRHFLTDHWSLYARTGTSARFGNVDEQVGVFGTISDLEPQTARTHEIGTAFSAGRLNSNVSFFYQNLTDEIRYNPLSFTNENLDKTRRKGIEVSSQLAMNEWLSINANYTYLSAKFREGEFDGNTVPLVPEHIYNIGLSASLPYGLRSSLNWQHVSNSYFANDSSNEFGKKIPSYQTVNFLLSKQINNLEVSLTINNVFDEEYYNFGVNGSAENGNFNAYPLAERTVFLSTSYKFD